MASRTARTDSSAQAAPAGEANRASESPVTALVIGGKSLSSLTPRLQHRDLVVSTLNHQQDILTRLRKETMDVLFVPATKRCFKLLEELRQQLEQPPIFVAIALDLLPVEEPHPAD